MEDKINPLPALYPKFDKKYHDILWFPINDNERKEKNDMQKYSEKTLRLLRFNHMQNVNTPQIINKKQITRKPSREPTEQT